MSKNAVIYNSGIYTCIFALVTKHLATGLSFHLMVVMNKLCIYSDERYMGCFTEDPNDKDLPHFLWDETERKSIDECVTECGVAGYNYSGEL